ncbi:hypothetical protein DQ04_22091000, partial [Trypanosoma grayi]|uniref:hypothetical protein n=1 Tax=Trypanosoma grayi TaxID=71804 RepID=UPI0004F488F3
AVGRPALFVVAVVLCCVCGCAATTAEGIGDEEQVILALQKAREKAVEAKEAVNAAKSKVDAVKSATKQFETEARTASLAASKLNEKVEGKTGNIQQEIIAELVGLANSAKATTNTSHASVALIVQKVKEAGEATTWAKELFTEAQGMADSATASGVEDISNEAKLAHKAFGKPSEVLTALSHVDSSAEKAKIAASQGTNAYLALNRADLALILLNEMKNNSGSSNTPKEIVTLAKEAENFAKNAVNDAALVPAAAIEAAKHAEDAVARTDLWLKQIDDAMRVLAKEDGKPEVPPVISQLPPPPPPPLPPGPSGEETDSQGLPQDPLSSTSPAGNEQLTPPNSDVHNTLQDIQSMDSSVSPSWVR